MPGKRRHDQGSREAKGLNSIHAGIHCSATTDSVGAVNELDEIAINNFLDTLAEVALAIASRKQRPEPVEELVKDRRGGELG